jgi:hypothetical protein
MRLSRTKIVGLDCVASGIALYGTSVDVPISTAIGRVSTREFKVNLTLLYTIEIEVQKKIPFETLNCLLGLGVSSTSSALQECPDRPSVVKASCSVSTDRRACVRQLHVGLGFSEGIQRFRRSGCTRCRCLICFL